MSSINDYITCIHNCKLLFNGTFINDSEYSVWGESINNFISHCNSANMHDCPTDEQFNNFTLGNFIVCDELINLIGYFNLDAKRNGKLVIYEIYDAATAKIRGIRARVKDVNIELLELPKLPSKYKLNDIRYEFEEYLNEFQSFITKSSSILLSDMLHCPEYYPDNVRDAFLPISIKDAAKLLGISEEKIIDWESGNSAPKRYPGRDIKLSLFQFAEYYKKHRAVEYYDHKENYRRETITIIAQECGVCRNTIYNWIKNNIADDGEPIYKKKGRAYFWYLSWIEENIKMSNLEFKSENKNM